MHRTIALLAAGLLIAGALAAPAADAKGKRGPRGPRGHAGAPGPQGIPGPQGGPGSAGIAQIKFVTGPDMPLCPLGGGPCSVVTATADCPPGMLAIGGGFVVSDVEMNVLYNDSGIIKWAVIAVNNGPRAGTVHATATCIGGAGIKVV